MSRYKYVFIVCGYLPVVVVQSRVMNVYVCVSFHEHISKTSCPLSSLHQKFTLHVSEAESCCVSCRRS